MTDDTAFLPLTDLLTGYDDGTLSPVEATAAVYDRIEAHDGALNLFCHLLDRAEAIAAAEEAAIRWSRNAASGPLDGVPLTVKDAIIARGWATLRGSKLSDASVPDGEDAPSVARVRAAGAIVIGKTTMPEFGWKGVTDCPLSGITRNPWNTAMTPGGSSGGSAAAVAAGIGHAAIGTDAGGSVRIPGSFCGLIALKPSIGRVGNYPPSAAGTMGHIGPITRTAADAALMLTVMAGSDPRDPTGLPDDGTDYRDGLDGSIAGIRVAFSPTLGYAKVDPEVAALVATAAEAFADLGARVERVDAPFPDPTDCFRTHFFAGIAHALRNVPAEKLSLLDPGLLPILDKARGIGLGQYMEAVDARVALSRTSKTFFETHDLLLTPTLAVPPFEVGRLSPDGYDQEEWMAWSPFTYPFNLTGQPALSVPCGFTASGLPVGLQIVGQYHADALVLRAAHAYQSAHPTWDRRPPLA